MSSSLTNNLRLKRTLFLLIAGVMILDVVPPEWVYWQWVKDANSRLTNSLGIWQGQWPLFAPNPVLNNGGVLAELHWDNGDKTTWESPVWGRTSPAQRFVQFRTMNFYDRLVTPKFYLARFDFADYLYRQSSSSSHQGPIVTQIQLLSLRKKMVIDEEDPFPLREETMWMNQTENLAEKSYHARHLQGEQGDAAK